MKKNPINQILKCQLTGEQAYMTVISLHKTIMTLWRFYGDEMADFEARVFPDDPPSLYSNDCLPNDEIPF